MDALSLARALIRSPSVTPDTGSAIDILAKKLEEIGFSVEKLVFSEAGTAPVMNLYARYGSGGMNFCFAGHTDVVPVGHEGQWHYPPFGGHIDKGVLYGRGASDMKSAIACFVEAASRAIHSGAVAGNSLSLLITGDEEGPAINGTRKLLDWLQARGETPDYCLVGEPTNPHKLGEMMKTGRRGSLHGNLSVYGTQGHVAYPHLAHNPIPALTTLLTALVSMPLDGGNDNFQPSNLEVVKISASNDSDNIIPAEAHAQFNIRFSDFYTSQTLRAAVEAELAETGVEYALKWRVSGDSFLTPSGKLTDAVIRACQQRLSMTPKMSTAGGTSDARFIKDVCPVVEFGLVGESMHKVDECCAVADIEALTDIYHHIIKSLFNG